MMRNRRKYKKVGRLAYPHALEQDYGRALKPVARVCLQALEKYVLPTLGMLGLPTNKRHMDAATLRLGSLGEEATNAVVRTYDPQLLDKLLRAKARGVDRWQLKQITRELVKATTISSLTGRLIQEDKSALIIDEFVRDNTALITKLPHDFFLSVQTKIKHAVESGTRVETLAKQLGAMYDWPENRAKLIARDQVGKLYGQLNKTRQKSVGINTYIWRTMGDERVRETHQELEDTVQDWDNPPATEEDGEQNNPGEAICCRCTGEPNLAEVDLS